MVLVSRTDFESSVLFFSAVADCGEYKNLLVVKLQQNFKTCAAEWVHLALNEKERHIFADIIA